jgi:CHASE3 domain sensor protein
MSGTSTTGLSLGVRGKILGLFAICTVCTLGAAAAGFWQLSASLDTFDREVMLSQRNAVAVVAMEAEFKTQVQEWKNTLLRGKNPEALKKYWSNFEALERDVRKGAEQLSGSIPDPEAKQLVMKFLDAHRGMGEAYRRGLQQFKEQAFDSAVGDKAVTGIDRAPTELLTKARERLISLAAALAQDATASAQRTSWTTSLVLAAVTAIAAALFLIAIQRCRGWSACSATSRAATPRSS